MDKKHRRQKSSGCPESGGYCLSSWWSIHNFDLESLAKVRVRLVHLCTLQLCKEISGVSHLLEDRNLQSENGTENMSAAQVASQNASG